MRIKFWCIGGTHWRRIASVTINTHEAGAQKGCDVRFYIRNLQYFVEGVAENFNNRRNRSSEYDDTQRHD